MNRRGWLLAIGLSVLASSAAWTEAAEPARPPVGINLGGVTYYSAELPFVDAMKMSKPWVPQARGKPYGQGPKPDLRPDGYPKSLAPDTWVDSITLLCDGHYAPGDYVCLYAGKGTLEFKGAKVTASAPGRIELAVVGDKNGVHIKLAATDPADPVHAMRLVPKAAEATYQEHPFRPEFLKRWGNMKALRFMDWMRTNGSKIAEWSDRPLPTDQTQGARGVALEHMIALANTMKADPWFCMPHLASDDFVRQFATMVKAGLAKDRKVYIEYSNETWNFQFAQTKYCAAKGKELKLSDNEYQGALRYHARRACEIFKIWEGVFGGRDRLVRVLAAQSANTSTTETICAYEDAAKKADALAIAPYFGHALGNPKTTDEVAALSADQVIERCRDILVKERATMEKQAALAKKFGLRLFAYEFGQHLVGHGGAENNAKLTALFIEANRRPAMKDLYLTHLRNWQAAGGDLCTIFSSMSTPSKWGSWGILEYEGQDPATAPKWQAVQEFIGEPRPFGAGR